MSRAPPPGVDRGAGLTGLNAAKPTPKLGRPRSRGGRDASIREVAFDRCGVTLGRRTITAGARGYDLDRFSGAQAAGSSDKWLHSVAKVENAAAAGLAALEPPGRCQQARAVEPQMTFCLGAVHSP